MDTLENPSLRGRAFVDTLASFGNALGSLEDALEEPGTPWGGPGGSLGGLGDALGGFGHALESLGNALGDLSRKTCLGRPWESLERPPRIHVRAKHFRTLVKALSPILL